MGDVDLGVVVNVHSSHHSHHGLGGYSKLTNGLRAAASGAFVCRRPSLLFTVNLYCKDGTSVVLSSMTPSFFPNLAMLRSYAVKLV